MKQGKTIKPNEMFCWYSDDNKRINACQAKLIKEKIKPDSWYYIASNLNQYQNTSFTADII